MSGATGRREVAHRLFATEYDDASLEYAESDEERAPNYVVTPTGARLNRAFVVGVLTSVEQVNEDTVRARIADPTGAFVVYAGQYQPDELAALQSMESPAFVAITGKANTFQPDGSDRVLTSIRPESVTEVDAETRDRWAVTAAEHTLGRIETAAEALAREERGDELVAALRRDGVDPSLAEGVARALEHYDTTADYLGTLREVALQAVEVVAGERSEAESLDVEPDASTGTYAAGDLQDSAPDAAAAVTDVAGPIEDVEIDDVEIDSDGAEAEEVAEADETADETVDDETTAGGTPTSASEETEASTTDEAETPSTDEAETPSSDESAESAPDETAAVSEETTAASEETSEAETASASAETAEPDAASSEDESTDGARDVDDGDVEEQADADDTAEQLDADDGEDVDPEDLEDVVDDEERERIEEEYGVGFESGAEVGEPGDADIDAPDDAATADEGTAGADATDEAGETADAGDAADADASTDASEDADDAAAPESDDAGVDASDEADTDEDAGDADDGSDADDVDLEAALLDEMADMDGDDGAERAALVDAVAADTGADESAVEDAIEDALMSGKCYEPSEGVYKPI